MSPHKRERKARHHERLAVIWLARALVADRPYDDAEFSVFAVDEAKMAAECRREA